MFNKKELMPVKAVEEALELLEENGVEPVALVPSGSFLYGTNNKETKDFDFFVFSAPEENPENGGKMRCKHLQKGDVDLHVLPVNKVALFSKKSTLLVEALAAVGLGLTSWVNKEYYGWFKYLKSYQVSVASTYSLLARSSKSMNNTSPKHSVRLESYLKRLFLKNENSVFDPRL